VIKDFDTAISESDLTTAKEKLALAEKRLMQAAAKGAIHKNTASRKVSRMARQFNSTKAE
jgi:small subunit ribosomal protein S20